MKALPILYKRAKTGAPQSWQIFVENNTFFTEAGQVGGVITRSSPTVCESKNTGRANQTSPEDQAMAEATSKHQHKLDKGYTENIDNIDTSVKFFEPMLAHKFIEYQDQITWDQQVYVQPKLDGHRAIITLNGATTRGGKSHMCIPHILETLQPMFNCDPSLVLDGELYTHDLCADFNRISSLVRKTKPTPEDLEEAKKAIQFHCYDAPRVNGLDMNSNFFDRFTTTSQMLEQFKINPLYVCQVPTIAVSSESEVYAVHDTFVKDGYEGAIVRLNAPYTHGRSNSLLKYKVFDDDEFIIESVLPGSGDKASMANTITTHSKSGEPFSSNIKAKHEFLKYMLKNAHKYVGKTCTIRYFGLTPDKQIPRFPYVIDIDREAYE